jgi:signal transduction histidine kinase
MKRPHLSLKFRITVTIFLLEAMMMATVLGVTLNHTRKSNLEQMTVYEQVLTNVLSDLSRLALFTGEYGELQPYIEQVVADPQVLNIIVADQNDRIVVSSDPATIGEPRPDLSNAENDFWRIQSIANASGELGSIAIHFSHKHLIAASEEARNLGMLIALVGMSVIAVVGFMIGFLMTRNLEKLTTAAQTMAEGDLSVRTRLRGNDEITIVGHAFDQMAASIDRYVEALHQREAQIRKANDELEQRITARTEELAIARDQALEANRTKSAFLANMSHELRTPLNAIIGYSDILTEDIEELGGEDMLADLSNIRNAGTHLLTLINDILDLSRIEAGKVEFNLSEFDAVAMIHNAVVTVTPMVEKNGNHIHVNIGDGVSVMQADEIKLRQILLNLLSNASKFTDHGNIYVDANIYSRGSEPGIRISVRDTGIGIPPDKMEKLFQEFSQVDVSSTRKYEGTGLGLTISRKLCVMMGGDISVSSTEGEGTTFTVRMPLSVKSPQQFADVDKPDLQPAVQYRLGNTNGRSGGERRSRVARILVIEDDRHMIDILSRFLTKEGFDMEAAETGTGGLEKAQEMVPDIIILDVMLPDTDGWEVLQTLRQMPLLSDTPVIILSMTDVPELGAHLGATCFLQKPLNRGKLLEIIHAIVRE